MKLCQRIAYSEEQFYKKFKILKPGNTKIPKGLEKLILIAEK